MKTITIHEYARYVRTRNAWIDYETRRVAGVLLQDPSILETDEEDVIFEKLKEHYQVSRAPLCYFKARYKAYIHTRWKQESKRLSGILPKKPGRKKLESQE